ncbi:MAG: S41 family peptidase [Candidatus Azobacteroides pseudotrichonymphae]|jgi:carboxyl-terminal processing protease|uniref:Carboxyl-terminal processing protease n=1 Tax=Azobacteroides pseudotrichonymphae genomovar. CFP2 TaxID=511995 RepID=B6YQ96_AZOPC|nr:S41 family peptidase [Candidatus Azobacteroides pseudotrichonymphae]MDR0530163.1 S41 family peptidase [Bacteroidales bacterium OttesenSCG-928-I14]BAG83368.1 carboxyl-terminal processing protease [Candidatus Azobacteroides pseudotrichonymphae genomovar. CFP2]GMO36746.1 MAG: S41 family peptidase [Candidatus Azobacteroides pseudotrichonymphae]
MKKKILLCFFSFCFVSCSYRQEQKDLSLQKIEMTIKAIESLYVDTINNDRLIEYAIISLIQKLDPHSNYMTSKEVKEVDESLQGNFEGIGIQFNILTDTLYVVQVISGGPSEKAGIMAGDRIIAVDGSLIAGVGMKNTDIMKCLRGPKGTVVSLKITRTGNSNPIVCKVVRDKIPIYSLDTSYMVDKKTGYIKLNCFGAGTYNEFKTALKELKVKGLKNLILDLQDNGGGYLQAAIDITNEFLRENNLIVYTEGAHRRREDVYATAKGSFMNGRVVVLVNEFTASASEIVSGALQDWDRAVIIGRRSFGKGLVQCPITFPDGSMIRLTTARYYTPTGRSIQKPYEKVDKESYEDDLIDRYNRGEMMIADSIHFSDSSKYNTLINRRVVYGKGGIMPDYFVPIDTSCYTDIYRSLMASGVINKFVMNFMDKNRILLHNRYKNFDAYKSRFYISDVMLHNLLEMFRKENPDMLNARVSSLGFFGDKDYKRRLKNKKRKDSTMLLTAEDIKQFEKSKSLIKLQVKALIARDLWNIYEYYQVINDGNNVLKKAVEIIESNMMYNKLLGK